MSTKIKPVRFTLTPERAAQLRKRGIIKGKPLRHSVAVESRYIAALMKLVNQMTAQTHREVLKSINDSGITTDAKEPTVAGKVPKASKTAQAMRAKFESLFKRRAPELANGMLEAVTKESAVNLHNSLKDLSGGLALKTDFINPSVKSAISGSVDENIGLISSIPKAYMDDVHKILHQAAVTGDNTAIINRLEKAAGISKRKAKNLALDQTRKAYATINQKRMEAVGVRRYEWLHSGGGAKARHKHITPFTAGGLNGGIFSYDDPPNAAEDGEDPYHANPAEMINCKCVAVPVLEFAEDEALPEEDEDFELGDLPEEEPEPFVIAPTDRHPTPAQLVESSPVFKSSPVSERS